MSQLAMLMSIWIWTLMGVLALYVCLSPDATGMNLLDRLRDALGRGRWRW